MWGGTIETTALVQPKVLYSTLGPPDSYGNVYCVGPIKPYIRHTTMAIIFLSFCSMLGDRRVHSIPYINGWIDFKKEFVFHKFQTCFKCFLPQETYLPPSHSVFKKGDKGKPCSMQDFVVLLLWFICHEADWWLKAQSAFPNLPAQPNEDEYAAWCLLVERNENFYNGLELVL